VVPCINDKPKGCCVAYNFRVGLAVTLQS